MEIFEIITGSASILSLIMSLFALNKINKIEAKNIVGEVKMKAKGRNLQQAGETIINNH